jgi:zinc transport system substrate-binding protein
LNLKHQIKARSKILKIFPLSLLTLVLLMILPVSSAYARLLVAVTVPAQAWLVNQIAGESVDILTLVPAGHVPESTQPGPRNLARFQQADIHFTVGHPDFFFETRYIRSYRKNAAVDSWLSMYEVAERSMPTHRLEGIDPHLWTSPLIMIATATVLEQKLSHLDPEHADLFQSNLQRLHEKINLIDGQIRTQLAGRNSDTLLVYHPAWGHFCQDYGLLQLAIEKDAKAPGAGSLVNLFTRLEKKNITNIISSPGADQRISSMIADQFGIKMILVNPMDADWLHMMSLMKQALENGSNHGR